MFSYHNTRSLAHAFVKKIELAGGWRADWQHRGGTSTSDHTSTK
jgi:hypothetical protein